MNLRTKLAVSLHGFKGTLLSGGQKQWVIMAARGCALVRHLLLDEATSSLRSESEQVSLKHGIHSKSIVLQFSCFHGILKGLPV